MNMQKIWIIAAFLLPAIHQRVIGESEGDITVDELYQHVAFLASDVSMNIVGQSISVDGGLTMY